MYTCEITEKQIVLDDFERGEIRGTEQSGYMDLEFENETLQGLLKDIIKFFGVSPDDIYTATRGGIINICRIENADGERAYSEDITEFCAGKCKLWNATYFGVVRQSLEVSEEKLNEAIDNIA